MIIPHYKLGALISAACLTVAGMLSSQADWTEVIIPGETQRPQDIVYFNGLYIAVGYDAEIITSTDGVTWTLQEVDAEPANPASPEFLPAFRGVAASDSLVVAVGDRGVVATSANGTEWTVTQQADLEAPGFQGIAFGAGKFVAANFSKTVSVSTNGVNWTDFNVIPDDDFASLQAITYTGEEFVAIPQSGNEAYISTDGEVWGSFGSGLFAFQYVLTLDLAGEAVYAGGKLSGGTGLAYADEEGPFSYLQLESPSTQAFISGVASGAGKIAAVGGLYGEPGETYLYVSNDGENFSFEQPDFSSVSTGIIYANGLWVIIGEGFAASTSDIGGGSGPTLPYLAQGATDLGDGNYDSWLGVINVNDFPWVFEIQFGAIFAGADGNTNAASWFYMAHPSLQGWFWTGNSTAPWVYGTPVGMESQWYYVGTEITPGYFYFFGANGEVVIGANAL